MLTFELPWAFLLLPVPLLYRWLLPEYRDPSDAVRAPFFARLVEITGTTPNSGAVVLGKNLIQTANLIAGWSLVVIALAQPVWVGDPVSRDIAARDMLLVVDLSGSMEATDFSTDSGEKVSRLDAVKRVLGEFVERRTDDRLGLAVFGSAAYPQASFTTDHRAVLDLLDELEPRMAGPQTMIGDAIGLAIRLFAASDKQNKVVILLTDGNDTGSKMPIDRATDIAADNGIVLHTIAMGDPQTVGEDALDLEILEQIANRTGGQFFVALNRADLDGIYAELDRLEPSLRQTLSYRPKRTLFHYPLAGMLTLATLLGLVMSFAPARLSGNAPAKSSMRAGHADV